MLSLVLAIKQQFNKLINGKGSQANRDQKMDLRHDQSRKCQIKLVKNR